MPAPGSSKKELEELVEHLEKRLVHSSKHLNYLFFLIRDNEELPNIITQRVKRELSKEENEDSDFLTEFLFQIEELNYAYSYSKRLNEYIKNSGINPYIFQGEFEDENEGDS